VFKSIFYLLERMAAGGYKYLSYSGETYYPSGIA